GHAGQRARTAAPQGGRGPGACQQRSQRGTPGTGPEHAYPWRRIFLHAGVAQELSVGALSPSALRRICSAYSASKLIGCSRNGGKPPSSTSEEIVWRAYGNSTFGQ